MFQNIRCQVVDWTSIVFLESILLTINYLLRLRTVLGDFGFFLMVDRNRRLNRISLGHFILYLHLLVLS